MFSTIVYWGSKDTLWLCFGDIIVENIKRNVKVKYIYCEKCGTLVEQVNNKIKYCKKCAREAWNEYNKYKQKEYYQKNRNSV